MTGHRVGANLASKWQARNDGEKAGAAKPFLRWVGGKFHLAPKLFPFVPADVLQRRYFEPFLGAGSLFFSLGHPRAFLSDLNGHLVECYQVIRAHYNRVGNALAIHKANDSEEYYYQIRDEYNRSKPGVARAARFIYLNRTGFNGVFRVNKSGAYNVPYGRKNSPKFPSSSDLRAIAKSLEKAHLKAVDYKTALTKASQGDFVYLDPPYPPLNGTSYFTHYTPNRFDVLDQAGVAATARALDTRGCLVLISNADTPAVRALYKGFQIHSISATRFVTSSSVKHRVGEVIITNY